MKKIILALCVALCFCSMALPAFAEETEEPALYVNAKISGVMKMPSKITELPDQNVATQGLYCLNDGYFISAGRKFDQIFTDNQNGKIYYKDYETNQNILVYADNQWVDIQYQQLNFSSVRVSYTATFWGWFETYGALLPFSLVFLSDFVAVFNALREQISVMHVVDVLALVAVSVVGLAFMWWGVRKLTAAVMKAFKKGKVAA